MEKGLIGSKQCIFKPLQFFLQWEQSGLASSVRDKPLSFFPLGFFVPGESEAYKACWASKLSLII